MSTEDGPGIRTTVFFKGCSLKCTWCHNPESISAHPQVHWVENRCIGCKICLEVCPQGALTIGQEGDRIDRGLCSGCGACAEECPGAALELLGSRWSLEDLIVELIKDGAYFAKSGGGITLGGGEPALQARFNEVLLTELKARHVHTALDTCGLCARNDLAKLLPCTDLLLFDLKAIDPEKHRMLTGSTNTQILENILYVRDCMKTRGYPKELWIRTPVIPGATAKEEDIRNIGRFIATNLDGCVNRWELCAFNNLCKDKYLRLGLDWGFKDCELLSELYMEKMAMVARNSGVNPDVVFISGSTKLEEGR